MYLGSFVLQQSSLVQSNLQGTSHCQQPCKTWDGSYTDTKIGWIKCIASDCVTFDCEMQHVDSGSPKQVKRALLTNLEEPWQQAAKHLWQLERSPPQQSCLLPQHWAQGQGQGLTPNLPVQGQGPAGGVPQRLEPGGVVMQQVDQARGLGAGLPWGLPQEQVQAP